MSCIAERYMAGVPEDYARARTDNFVRPCSIFMFDFVAEIRPLNSAR